MQPYIACLPHLRVSITSKQTAATDQPTSSSQPTPSDSQIINLELLEKHMNEVANHAATCQAYQSKYGSVSLDSMMVMPEPTRCGMASILCSGCSEKISFSTSTKVEAPNSSLYGVPT